jgi:hypothetical protein
VAEVVRAEASTVVASLVVEGQLGASLVVGSMVVV